MEPQQLYTAIGSLFALICFISLGFLKYYLSIQAKEQKDIKILITNLDTKVSELKKQCEVKTSKFTKDINDVKLDLVRAEGTYEQRV